MYVWQPCGHGLLYVFNLRLNGELFLTQRLVYRHFDHVPRLHIRRHPDPNRSEFPQDFGPHFLALAC
jgi:hypothetical protein